MEIPSEKPLIGVSSCLLGNQVRFDSGHKRDTFINDVLRDYLDFHSVCPEVEAGFPVPRNAMVLKKNQEGEHRLVVSRFPDQDMTAQMMTYTEHKVAQLDMLDGFIFKKSSPSCGVFRVAVVVSECGFKERNAQGLFSRSFQQQHPLVPVEEEGRLNDAVIRENFFERLYAYKRWKMIPQPDTNVEGFIQFHSRHKLMLMARGSSYYQELGRMVSGVTRKDLAQRREAYIQRFMQVMQQQTTRGRQVNVLQHIMGYIKEHLSASDKQELLAIFESYRQTEIPLITPIAMLKHYLRLYPQEYIIRQHYLEPYPEKLALRSFH